MAECTAYTSIVVSGAGSTNIDGTYTPAGTTAGFTNFIISGGSLNQIIQFDNTPGELRWKIRRNPFPGSGFTSPYYQSQVFATSEEVPACPTDANVTWEIASSGSGPVPTVTGTPAAPSQNTFGLPADVVALITSRFGSVARFLRLRNQGQI
jgi:hypothetical protein